MMSTKNLPHEVVIEILSWLPVKHLLPLRCVSKSWLQLLTKDAQFAKLQFSRSNNSHSDPSILARGCGKENSAHLFLATGFTSCDNAIPFELPFFRATNTYRLCGICNGLLCLSRNDGKEVYIWNPLIKEHVTISCPSIHCQSRAAFAFGFDQCSNAYKVVKIVCEFEYDARRLDFHTQASVYTLGIDPMWKTIERGINCLFTPTFKTAPLLNGVLHWLTSRPGTYSIIFGFDIKDDVFVEIVPPFGIKFDDIVELGGSLCVINTRDGEDVEIWVMKEYGVVDSWTKQLLIEKPPGWNLFYNLEALGIAQNGEIILKKYVERLILYNPKTNLVRDLKPFRFSVLFGYAYIGSIISPRDISRVTT